MDRSILKFTIWNKNISSLNFIFEFWKVRFQFRKFIIKAIINEIVRKLINDKITSH